MAIWFFYILCNWTLSRFCSYWSTCNGNKIGRISEALRSPKWTPLLTGYSRSSGWACFLIYFYFCLKAISLQFLHVLRTLTAEEAANMLSFLQHFAPLDFVQTILTLLLEISNYFSIYIIIFLIPHNFRYWQ